MSKPSIVAWTRLLRKRQAGRVVQRDVAAVRHDSVDERELARLERERAIALVQQLLDALGMPGDYFVENIVLVDRDGTQAPAGAAEIFAVGIDAEGVSRELTHERAEARHEGSVDVVREQDKIRPLLKHGPDLLNRLGRECHGKRVARVDNEERLDLGVEELLDLLVRVLEFLLLLRMNFDEVEVVVFEVRHL